MKGFPWWWEESPDIKNLRNYFKETKRCGFINSLLHMLNCHGIRSKKPKGRKFLSIVPQIKSACSFVYSWCFCHISDDIYLIFSQFHVSGIPTILDSTNLFYQPTLCNSSLLNIHMHTYIHSSVHTHTNIHNLVL